MIHVLFIMCCCLSTLIAKANEPIIGGPCDGCEYVFINQPKTLSSHTQIHKNDTKGEPLLLRGTVKNSGGKPIKGIIIYAYQTDTNGLYPKGQTRHGSLRAWTISDAHGNYSFSTIRPGSYPERKTAQHIHLHVIEPDVATYYIDDVTFTDDPLIDAGLRGQKACRGGCGLTTPKHDVNGVWQVRRDITLGENIHDYLDETK